MYGLASTFQSYVDASTSIENAYMYFKTYERDEYFSSWLNIEIQ